MLTTLTVLTMSFVSTAKHLSNKTKLDGKLTIFIVIGSIFGGMIGGKIFDLITIGYNLEVISIIQSIIFVVMLTFVIHYVLNKSKFKQYKISNPLFCIILGVVLGANAAFLGVGGGPLNVAMFTIFFSFDIKKAAVHSLVIKLFSQLSKVTMIALTTGFMKYDLSMLIYMVPAAFFGGLTGATLSKRLSEEFISKLFIVVISITIFTNLFTILYTVYY